MDPERDAEFLEWLADGLPPYATANAQRLRECAQHIRELAKRETKDS